MRLIELLKRWAELEPNLCQPPDLAGGAYRLTAHGGAWHVFELDAGLQVILMRVQYCVQRAIATHHGWDMVLQSGLTLGDKLIYFAIVRHADGTEFISVDDVEPAIALLSAYIAALEALVSGHALVVGGGENEHAS